MYPAKRCSKRKHGRCLCQLFGLSDQHLASINADSGIVGISASSVRARVRLAVQVDSSICGRSWLYQVLVGCKPNLFPIRRICRRDCIANTCRGRDHRLFRVDCCGYDWYTAPGLGLVDCISSLCPIRRICRRDCSASICHDRDRLPLRVDCSSKLPGTTESQRLPEPATKIAISYCDLLTKYFPGSWRARKFAPHFFKRSNLAKSSINLMRKTRIKDPF